MNTIEQIYTSEQKRFFTVSDAKEILPLIYHITEEADRRVKKMINRLEVLQKTNLVLCSEIEAQINVEVSKWQNKINRLGVVPKGMWLADFDNGKGYYCWKFPENDIRYFHGYQDGFSGRVELT